jgi:hypothetical protein
LYAFFVPPNLPKDQLPNQLGRILFTLLDKLRELLQFRIIQLGANVIQAKFFTFCLHRSEVFFVE